MGFIEGEVIGHTQAVEKVSQKFRQADAPSAAEAGLNFGAFTARREAAPFQIKSEFFSKLFSH
jgi:hypothetical protein